MEGHSRENGFLFPFVTVRRLSKYFDKYIKMWYFKEYVCTVKRSFIVILKA